MMLREMVSAEAMRKLLISWRRFGVLLCTVLGVIVSSSPPVWSGTEASTQRRRDAEASPLRAVECFAVSDLDKIFPDGYQCPSPRQVIDLFGIRDEYVSGQCVLRARADLRRVTLRVTALAQEGGAAVIPAKEVAWNFVGSVPLKENSLHNRSEQLLRPAPALFPDYLSEETARSIKAGTYQAVWLTIHISRHAAPGRYEGTVQIRTNPPSGGASLPLRLTVYPLTLPERRHLMVTLWYRTNHFNQFHQTGETYSDRFFQVLKSYAEAMAAHRQNVFRVGLDTILIRQDAKRTFKLDFSRFDQWANVFWNTGKMDLLETGFVGRFAKGWSGPDIVLRDFRVIEESTQKTVRIPGEEVLPRLLPALEQHLQEKGWLEKTLFHVADEPSNHNLVSWHKVSRYVHEHAPSLRRMDAIEATNFFGVLEVWVPKLIHFYSWLDNYKEAQRQGYELWYYTAMSSRGAYPNRFIDFPLIETRLMHWVNYRYGLTGYLHYGLNSWSANPFEEMNAPRYGIGGHWIAYPKKDGLLSSIRWETMRNSIQDYEYFWLLEDALRRFEKHVGGPKGWFDPTQRGLEIASRVIPTMSSRTRDPEVLYNARRQVIQEILNLARPPRLVVQTNPPEGARILYGPAFAEVLGWTEPGTTITANGRELLVHPDGFFSTLVHLTADRNVVALTAENSQGRETVTRSFQVMH